MEKKLRISHKSFEINAYRFQAKFLKAALSHSDANLHSWNDIDNILNLVEKIVKSYKAKSHRRYSAYTHKINNIEGFRIDGAVDEYKVSYTFKRVDGKLKLHFKLHLRKQGWVRPHRITELVIRINEK